jgi:hypothetical protein
LSFSNILRLFNFLLGADDVAVVVAGVVIVVAVVVSVAAFGTCVVCGSHNAISVVVTVVN